MGRALNDRATTTTRPVSDPNGNRNRTHDDTSYCAIRPAGFAQSLIDAGVPVAVVKSGTSFPSGWPAITAAECDLSNFVYGQDDLAAVAGHGVDVVDIDSKAGARPEDLPIFRQYGIVRTPTGGWHFYVPSTGYGQISPLRVAGKVVGDYCGGTRQGGSRRLFYLPGSARLNHSDPRARVIQRGYMVQTPVDLDALFDSDPDDRLIDMLVGAGGSLSGEPGEQAVSDAETTAFLATHSSRAGPPV